MGSLDGKNIVLGVTGSIAAYKAAEIVRLLTKQKAQVFVIMTEAAQQFITPLTMRTLSGHPVHTDMFAADVPWELEHLSLSDKADLILVAPASADLIGRVVGGLANDLLSATLMATRKPVVIAPAMNVLMYTNPIVQANIRRLSDMGYHFCGPVEGPLAEGISGLGRMEEPANIVAFAENLLAKPC